MRSMRVAAVQHDITWCDRDANFEHIAELVAGAAACDARLVVLTEMFSTGFATDRPDLAEPEGGPSSRFLAEQARTHGIWLGGSCPEAPDDGDPRPFNTFVLASPDGALHRYRKLHPFTHGGEGEHFRAGDRLVTVDVDGFRTSLFICYDLRFADEMWEVAERTDLYLVPASWPASRRSHWTALLQARATENQAYVVGCNRVGSGGGVEYQGDSCVVDPFGELLATASHTESILLADISTERVAEVRDRYRFLQDRRRHERAPGEQDRRGPDGPRREP